MFGFRAPLGSSAGQRKCRPARFDPTTQRPAAKVSAMTIQGVIAANRFGLGAKPGEVARISGDPKAWLLGQLTPETDLPAPLRSLPSTVDDMSAFFKWLRQIAAEAKAHGIDPYSLRPGAANGA